MGSSSVVTQRAEERGERLSDGPPTCLRACACARLRAGPGSVRVRSKAAADSAERQKPCCDLCGPRYERWLRSSKTSI